MRQFKGLAGGEMDVVDPVTGCNIPDSLDLCRRDHTGGQAETDDTEIGITFGDDPTLGEEILIDRLFSTGHISVAMLVALTDRDYHVTKHYRIQLPNIVHMTKQSEYMEAFFGVELNQKFEDMISELKDAEDNLKALSAQIGTLNQNISPEEFKEVLKEARAIAYENAQQIKDVRTFLDFYLKSDKTSTHIILERDAYMKIYQIFKWDGSDVRDLKRWIKELREICDKIGLNMRDLLNFKKLTAQPVPEELAKFPVYALDRQGWCLTGAAFDQVMHIDEVREKMEENNSS
jgi:hypothetical protein